MARARNNEQNIILGGVTSCASSFYRMLATDNITSLVARAPTDIVSVSCGYSGLVMSSPCHYIHGAESEGPAKDGSRGDEME